MSRHLSHSIITKYVYGNTTHRAGLKTMQPMHLHWAPRHGVYVDCSFFRDTLALENSIETALNLTVNKPGSR